jgi:hypothetical protein
MDNQCPIISVQQTYYDYNFQENPGLRMNHSNLRSKEVEEIDNTFYSSRYDDDYYSSPSFSHNIQFN